MYTGFVDPQYLDGCWWWTNRLGLTNKSCCCPTLPLSTTLCRSPSATGTGTRSNPHKAIGFGKNYLDAWGKHWEGRQQWVTFSYTPWENGGWSTVAWEEPLCWHRAMFPWICFWFGNFLCARRWWQPALGAVEHASVGGTWQLRYAAWW